LLSEAPGAAEHLHGSFVTYTKENKTRALEVPERLLAEQGAVCGAVDVAMAKGALSHSPADIAVSVTGVAGPDLTRTAIPSAAYALRSPAQVWRLGNSNIITAVKAATSCRRKPWRTPSSFSSLRWRPPDRSHER
jgi:hypothetical protein